ncbi:MAG TPA: dTDP-4-dehydrorhamnose 3,5-epimerase [Candidatus Hydrogenedentes bacterium]|nr:dTDP-4-dehydrorhamnose 3,5-epimerase [Candidatus Hydrogenedentota bacterium]HOK90564.1 dTDP-4-dehydrorhamnose 3,5-epimerase [Candidatus Hydrogenedentota bacterium]HOV61837.1 dTDP-4-dehydrorhamnose 3,5-epimerase [Candidatus Hydrogenedentota bacterium]
MEVRGTPIEGLLVIQPKVWRDDRGFFLESYQARRYADAGLPERFVQDNHSCSARGVLRGLHGQFPRAQGKLVRVIEGEIWDVAVDLRPGSPTYGRHYGLTLTADNFLQFYIPPGFAHGFCVLSDRAQLEYKCTEYYYPEDEFVLRWDDPALAIPWPVRDPILSSRDQGGLPLAALEEALRSRGWNG